MAPAASAATASLESRRAASPPPVAPVAAPRVAGGVARAFGNADISRDRVIAGRVVSPQDVPVEGAAVVVVGTTSGVLTDARGEFVLRSSGDSAALLVRRLGFESVRLSLPTPPTDTARARVTLKASNQTLSAVVVQAEQRPPAERVTVGLSVAPLTAAPTESAAATARSQCWTLRPSSPAEPPEPTGSLPPAVMRTTDLGVASEVISQWIDWPIAGRETSVSFVRDARGEYRGTGVGPGVQWTLTLTRRGTEWDVRATRAVSGAVGGRSSLAGSYVMTSAAASVCKR